MGDMSNFGNYRVPMIPEPSIVGGGMNLIRTPYGNVPSTSTAMPPPLPPPLTSGSNYQSSMMYGGGNMFSSPYSSYGGMGYGGSYGGFMQGYGGGGFNRFGNSYMNPNDPENRFVQLAEESSRPAFQSIESLVGAIGNIAQMLDSTFFAITSTFRAILGVAANFGRLRGVFAQFWHTFAIFRGLAWVYRKLLYWLKISKIDPSSEQFQKAFASAINGNPGEFNKEVKGTSSWPIITFLGFMFTAPYLIMKLMGTVKNTAIEESRNPNTWINPISAKIQYDFTARNSSELSLRAGQTILVAPKEIQNTHNLLNTGWALATSNRETSGIIPISYIQPKMQPQQVPSTLQNSPPTATLDEEVISTDPEGPLN